MSAWVLILILNNGNGVDHIEYRNKFSCELEAGKYFKSAVVTASCSPKNTEADEWPTNVAGLYNAEQYFHSDKNLACTARETDWQKTVRCTNGTGEVIVCPAQDYGECKLE